MTEYLPHDAEVLPPLTLGCIPQTGFSVFSPLSGHSNSYLHLQISSYEDKRKLLDTWNCSRKIMLPAFIHVKTKYYNTQFKK